MRAQVLTAAGAAAWEQGDYSQAEPLLQESLAIWRGLGDRAGLAEATHFIGHLVFDQQQYDRALELFRESLALYRELSDDPNCLPLIADLGLVAYHQGDYTAARASFEEVFAQVNAHGHRDGIAECLAALSGVAVAEGQTERGAALSGAAAALLRRIGAPLAPADRLAWEQEEKRAQAQLGLSVYAASRMSGEAMTIEQAIALAQST